MFWGHRVVLRFIYFRFCYKLSISALYFTFLLRFTIAFKRLRPFVFYNKVSRPGFRDVEGLGSWVDSCCWPPFKSVTDSL